MEKILIIDSNSIMNRAFFGLPPMVTTEGIHTNAVYGYINMLSKLQEEIKADYVVATFDRKAPTFRHQAYEDYKAGRKKMAPELAEQLPIMKEVLDAMSISVLEIDGYEADDIIGTLSLEAENIGMEVYILSGDKDNLQLASDKTKVVITKKGITDKAIYDKAAFVEEFGITPVQFIDVKGLMGDKSDNIPGVPGIGEKTAFQLIKDYGSIEGVYQNIESISRAKLKQNLEENMESASFSKKLATIKRDVPIELNFDEIKSSDKYDLKKLREIYLKLQFKTLLSKLPETGEMTLNGPVGESDNRADSEEVEKVEYKEIKSEEDFNISDEELKNSEVLVSFTYFEDVKLSKREIEYIYLSVNEKNFVMDFSELSHNEKGKDLLKKIFESEDVKRSGYNVKNAFSIMKKHGISFKKVDFDVLLATYLLEPNKGQYSLKDLISTYLFKEIQGSGHELKIMENRYIDDLRIYLEKEIEDKNLHELFYDVEMPLTNILSDMELEGFKVDEKVLDELGARITSEIERIQKEIYELADEEFNISSPKQLGVILFEKLDLPPLKKTKTGYSTNQEVLDSLKDKHPIIEKIMYYRQLTKINSTYITGLKDAIDVDSRIHSNFQQTLAVTGRLSSTEPNLQNIPIRFELGREIRKAFIPDDSESLILSSDYSQIELRVLADISDDANMQDAFKSGVDIHTKTASEVFNKKIEDVTKTDRSNAKAVNFGIIYGISDFALSQDLKITRAQAKEYIEKYYDRYPKIREYFDKTISDAKKNGYVTTIMNRVRQIPEINASNKIVQSAGVRLAMNSPIQGSAADIIKCAMVKVYDALKREGLQSRIILQVHDEIIINMKKNEEKQVRELVDREMKNAYKLDVRLVSEQSSGENWYDAK